MLRKNKFFQVIQRIDLSRSIVQTAELRLRCSSPFADENFLRAIGSVVLKSVSDPNENRFAFADG